MNCRLFVSLNGVGTAHFDPREAVAKFLTSKNRRYREPDYELYTHRAYVENFFSSENKL